MFARDDTNLPRESAFLENIDYMGSKEILSFHLFTCWKEFNLVSSKHKADICVQIPLTNSRRLENILWRRWDKQLWNLPEISPAHINWNKSQDVTWLYGPKYTNVDPFSAAASTPASQPLSTRSSSNCCSPCDYDLDAVLVLSETPLLASSMSFDSVSDLSSDDYETGPKSVLKTTRSLQKQTKRVLFSCVVNLREYCQGFLFDYDFLDSHCM